MTRPAMIPCSSSTAAAISLGSPPFVSLNEWKRRLRQKTSKFQHFIYDTSSTYLLVTWPLCPLHAHTVYVNTTWYMGYARDLSPNPMSSIVFRSDHKSRLLLLADGAGAKGGSEDVWFDWLDSWTKIFTNSMLVSFLKISLVDMQLTTYDHNT